MKRGLHLVLALCIILLFNAPLRTVSGITVVNPGEVGFSNERLYRVNQVIQSYVDEKKIAGAVTLIARKGRIAQFQPFGMADIEAQKPMHTDTIFRIASMTKPVTAVAVMMLYEEGKFLLSDPLSKYLPEFQNPQVLVLNEERGAEQPYKLIPAKKPITIHNLLTHTAGLTYTFQGTAYVSDMYKRVGVSDGLSQTEGTIGDMVAKLSKVPLCRQPSEGFDYGLSMDVAGRLVEVISGMSLDEFFRERIFKPLGMKDTYFYLPEEKVSRLSGLYKSVAEGKLEKYSDEPVNNGLMRYSASYHYKGPKTYFSGGAGLVSTAEDYWRFLQMLLNGGEFNGVRLLSRKTIELMTANHIGDTVMWDSPFDGYRFGLGFAVRTDLGAAWEIGSVGEYTWGGFFYTNFWVDPKEQLIGIMLVQQRPNTDLDLYKKFRVLTYQAIND